MSDAATVRPAAGPADIATVASLFREYQAGLGVSLCFQGFDEELASLPGKYAPPGGFILLAERGAAAAGVVALRPLDADGTAEMKRLYLRADARGLGLGRRLVEAAIARARAAGYRRLRLDTLAQMHAAASLYLKLGFREIPPYYENPLPGARYFEVPL